MENGTIRVNILAFGMTAEVMKTTNFSTGVPASSDELKAWLYEKFPGLKEMDLRMSVNRKIIQGDTALCDGDEVALLPPFSGG